MKVSLLACFFAAALAPLTAPLTGGWLYFLLHQWFYPSEWGLPPLQSLIGVSINCTAVAYFVTWFYGLPLSLVLRRLNQYHLSYLLVAAAAPAVTLPFW